MRNPSLHITRSELEQLLRTAPKNLTIEEVSFWICAEAKKKRLSYRMQPQLTKKQHDKLYNSNSTVDEDYVKVFNGIYMASVRNLGHLGVDLINAHSKQYELLKKVTKLAYEFVSTFELQVNEGLKFYCEMGLELMNKKYSLNKFVYLNVKIGEKYRYFQVIQDDDDREGTKLFIKLWKAAMNHYGGSLELVKFTTDKNASFVFSRQDADIHKADYKDWIRAQFEELAFLNSLPEISQFHGDQAAYRYKMYLANKGSTEKKKESNENITEEHREYLKKLKG